MVTLHNKNPWSKNNGVRGSVLRGQLGTECTLDVLLLPAPMKIMTLGERNKRHSNTTDHCHHLLWRHPHLPMRATLARRRAGIILLNPRNTETCNKKEKTPLHDHLEYLPVQNPLSE